MRTYFGKCKMINGDTVSFESKNRDETLEEYVDFITKTNSFNTFINEDGLKAQVINMNHVISMDITYKEEPND